MKKVINDIKEKINLKLFIILLLLTQILKLLFSKANITIIPNLLKINYQENTGIAFGYMNQYTSIVIIINIILIYLLLKYIKTTNMYNNKSNIYLTIFLSGSIGNLIERIYYGYVTDYISIMNFPVFNLADVCIVCGLMLLVIKSREI